MANAEITVPMKEVMAGITLTVRPIGVRGFNIRWMIGMSLIRLASKIIGVQFEKGDESCR